MHDIQKANTSLRLLILDSRGQNDTWYKMIQKWYSYSKSDGIETWLDVKLHLKIFFENFEKFWLHYFEVTLKLLQKKKIFKFFLSRFFIKGIVIFSS